MAVYVELQNNQFCPVLRCDHCVQIIDRGQRTALLAIRRDGRPLTGEIICLHRVCTVRYQAAHQGRYQDLEEHVTTRPAAADLHYRQSSMR